MDGTYQLTAWTEYGITNAGSLQNQETFVFQGNTFQAVTTPDGVAKPAQRFSGTFETSGNNFTLHATCPAPGGTFSVQYEVTATGYRSFDPKAKRLTVYTKL